MPLHHIALIYLGRGFQSFKESEDYLVFVLVVLLTILVPEQRSSQSSLNVFCVLIESVSKWLLELSS
jgi:hypothetical protein